LNTKITSLKLNKTLSLLYAGFLISFVGSLPPGTTNLILIDIAGGNTVNAISFAIGCFVAELLCVKFCLMIIHGAYRLRFLQKIIQWLSLALLILLSFASFMISTSFLSAAAAILLPDSKSPFVIGFLIMIFNPVQIPFWTGWTLIVVERRSATLDFSEQLMYLLGIGVGSLLASAAFIFAGDYLSGFLQRHQQVLHFILGCTFGVMAIIQAKRISMNPTFKIED
jgi:threonine/homoserine/homoserine lactone efflux protein